MCQYHAVAIERYSMPSVSALSCIGFQRGWRRTCWAANSNARIDTGKVLYRLYCRIACGATASPCYLVYTVYSKVLTRALSLGTLKYYSRSFVFCRSCHSPTSPTSTEVQVVLAWQRAQPQATHHGCPHCRLQPTCVVAYYPHTSQVKMLTTLRFTTLKV